MKPTVADNKPIAVELKVDVAAKRLANFFDAFVELMQAMARACGHDHLSQFNRDDLAAWDKSLAELAGIEWSGYSDQR